MALKSIKIVLLSVLVALLFFSTWFFIEFSLPQNRSGKGVVFEVEKGKGASSIAQSLKDKGVIKKKWPFLLAYKIFFPGKSLKAGEYSLEPSFSTKDILKALTEGQIILHSITIPEGLTRLEIGNLLQSQKLCAAEDFVEASNNPQLISSLDKKASDLEGYLFPETYHFPRGTSGNEIVSTMVSQFKEIFNKEWTEKAHKMGLTVREVVTLASLIEKETSLSEERNLVSAVFHNRLKRRMKLDCDPTIIFVLKQEGKFQGRLHTKDMNYDSPYNTYLYPGLPPGPIANPGKESLQAALYPAKENYLYFVSKNDGSHTFSSNFQDHQKAVSQYQKRKKQP